MEPWLLLLFLSTVHVINSLFQGCSEAMTLKHHLVYSNAHIGRGTTYTGHHVHPLTFSFMARAQLTCSPVWNNQGAGHWLVGMKCFRVLHLLGGGWCIPLSVSWHQLIYLPSVPCFREEVLTSLVYLSALWCKFNSSDSLAKIGMMYDTTGRPPLSHQSSCPFNSLRHVTCF